jgi:hypothetical protein
MPNQATMLQNSVKDTKHLDLNLIASRRNFPPSGASSLPPKMYPLILTNSSATRMWRLDGSKDVSAACDETGEVWKAPLDEVFHETTGESGSQDTEVLHSFAESTIGDINWVVVAQKRKNISRVLSDS